MAKAHFTNYPELNTAKNAQLAGYGRTTAAIDAAEVGTSAGTRGLFKAGGVGLGVVGANLWLDSQLHKDQKAGPVSWAADSLGIGLAVLPGAKLWTKGVAMVGTHEAGRMLESSLRSKFNI